MSRPDESAAEPIEFWSDAMAQVVGRVSRAVARRSPLIDPDDVSQDIWLSLVLYARREGDSPIARKLIYGIARRRAHLLRRESERAARDREAVERPTPAQADADAVMDVRAAVESLPPRLAEVVRGRWFAFESFEHLAQRWGLKPGTVKDAQKDAYRLLRGGLETAYGREAARKRKARAAWGATRAKLHRPSYRRADWSQWGPLPNQRDDQPRNLAR